MSAAVSSVTARLAFSACRVLLVEDDPDMRLVLQQSLESDGHVVRACGRVDEALTAVDGEEAFDVVITDVRLPGASGLELLAALRSRRVGAARIVITGFGTDDVHDEATSLGAAVVFDKPFDVDDLRTAVVHVAPRTNVASDS